MRWDAILYIQQRSVVQQSARTHAHAQDLLSKKGGHTKYVSHHHSMQGTHGKPRTDESSAPMQ